MLHNGPNMIENDTEESSVISKLRPHLEWSTSNQIVLYLSISIAIHSAWAIQKRSRLYSINVVSELRRRSATGNCEWWTCPRSLRGG